MFGGSDEGPPGPSWLIHGPLPGVRWAEEKYCSFGCFERDILVFPLLESGQGKWACSGGKYFCLGALMEVPGMIHLAILRENHWALPSSSSGKRVCSAGKYSCLGALMGVAGALAG